MFLENDTEIIDVNTFAKNDMIKVNWKLRNFYHLNAEFNEPVMFTIRYKVLPYISLLI